jgi:hypothetical protein
MHVTPEQYRLMAENPDRYFGRRGMAWKQVVFVLAVFALGVLLFVLFRETGERVKLARVCLVAESDNCFDIYGIKKLRMLPPGLAGYWSLRDALPYHRCKGGACSVMTLYDQSGADACDGPCDATQATPDRRPLFPQ